MSAGDYQIGPDELQQEFRDLLCLAVVGDHLRWVVTGEASAAFADWLIDAAAQWREWADQVAKQLVQLGVPPDGRVRSLEKDLPLNWVPDGWLPIEDAQQLIAIRLGRMAGWARQRRALTTDASFVGLLDAVCSGLDEQHASLPVAARS